MPSAKLSAKARKVRLLLLDVDGVLTDGCLYVGEADLGDGRMVAVEAKAFHIHDGHGMKMAARAGLLVGWVSSRYSAVTSQRAREFGVTLVAQPAPGQKPPPPKLDMVRKMAKKIGIGLDEICFLGDDLVDLPVLRAVGMPAAVANAVAEVRAAAAYVTRLPGGHGAARELIELVLKAQGLWNRLLERYRSENQARA
ncbi:MAG: HAD hydrolase family protein [Verrucomicrobiae bacterium]|nr:HAD hydrolase family protein [Verrucomicrobiae bacterium]